MTNDCYVIVKVDVLYQKSTKISITNKFENR